MKRFFTLFLVSCCSLALFAETYSLDSADLERDGEIYRYVFSYDSNNRLVENCIYKKDVADLIKYARETYSYDGSNVTQVLTYLFQDEDWSLWKKEAFVYSNGFVVSADTAEMIGGVWVSKRRNEYNYDGDKLVQHTVYNYSTSNKKLQYEKQTQYSYADGLLTKVVVKTGEVLGSNSLYEYTYDAGKVKTMVESKWNSDLTDWVLNNTYTYTYGDATMTVLKEAALKDWEDKITSIRSVYTYDVQGRELSMVSTKNSHEEGVVSSDWNNYQRRISSYTIAGDVSSIQSDEWKSNTWSEVDKQTYSYADEFTLADVPGAQSAIKNGLDYVEEFSGALSYYERSKNKNRVCYEKLYYNKSVESAVPTILTTDIFAFNGRIYSEQPIRIYSVEGIDVTSNNGNLSGIYVVKTATQTYKLLVR